MCPENVGLHQEVADWVAGQGDVRVIIGGDWQVAPQALSPEGGKSILGHALDPGEPSCTTAEGIRQATNDYFVVNEEARH